MRLSANGDDIVKSSWGVGCYAVMGLRAILPRGFQGGRGPLAERNCNKYDHVNMQGSRPPAPVGTLVISLFARDDFLNSFFVKF